jgi:hypothetical protein
MSSLENAKKRKSTEIEVEVKVDGQEKKIKNDDVVIDIKSSDTSSDAPKVIIDFLLEEKKEDEKWKVLAQQLQQASTPESVGKILTTAFKHAKKQFETTHPDMMEAGIRPTHGEMAAKWDRILEEKKLSLEPWRQLVIKDYLNPDNNRYTGSWPAEKLLSEAEDESDTNNGGWKNASMPQILSSWVRVHGIRCAEADHRIFAQNLAEFVKTLSTNEVALLLWMLSDITWPIACRSQPSSCGGTYNILEPWVSEHTGGLFWEKSDPYSLVSALSTSFVTKFVDKFDEQDSIKKTRPGCVKQSSWYSEIAKTKYW